MTWGGPAPQRGHIAHSLALLAGATPLGALIVGESASFYYPCFEKDAELAKRVVQNNGRHPHPRSVARARRQVTKLGILESKRIFAGQKAKGALWRTTGGTTDKSVRWDRLGSKDPVTRGDRRRGRLRELAIQNARVREERRQLAEQEALQVSARPKYSAPPAPPPDPVLAKVLEEATAIQEAKWERRDQAADARMMDSVLRPPPPKPKPPD